VCVRWLSTESHSASLRRATSVTWDPGGIRSLIGQPAEKRGRGREGEQAETEAGAFLGRRGSLFNAASAESGWLAGDQPVSQAEWRRCHTACQRTKNDRRCPRSDAGVRYLGVPRKANARVTSIHPLPSSARTRDRSGNRSFMRNR